MGWTRARYEEQTRKLMDAVKASYKWTSEDLKLGLGATFKNEWKRLLEKNVGIRSEVLAGVTRDAQGRVLLTALSQGTGDTARVYYKTQAVGWTGTGTPLREFPRAPTAFNGGDTPRQGWWIENGYLWASPAGTEAIDVRIQTRPCSIEDLSEDTVQVTWPDGHEFLLCYMTAYLILPKAGAEADFAKYCETEAKELRRLMYQELWRPGADPVAIGYTDSENDWTDSARWGF